VVGIIKDSIPHHHFLLNPITNHPPNPTFYHLPAIQEFIPSFGKCRNEYIQETQNPTLLKMKLKLERERY